MNPALSTNINQSRRLLSCGVDSKTADLVWLNRGQYPAFLSFNEGCHRAIPEVGDVPAWSLSRLISLLPHSITDSKYYRLVMGPNESNWEIEYKDLSVVHNLKRVIADTPIEVCVQMIEWLTANGYSLNKIEE